MKSAGILFDRYMFKSSAFSGASRSGQVSFIIEFSESVGDVELLSVDVSNLTRDFTARRRSYTASRGEWGGRCSTWTLEYVYEQYNGF